MKALKHNATYADLYGIPESYVGEIIGGELYASPRPAYRHAFSASALGVQIGGAFQFGINGPGGWLVLDEPELRLADDVLVQLLTTVFFAGLETYEGERNPIGVAFLGTSRFDFVMPEGPAIGATPLYQWKVLRFASPRPFAIPNSRRRRRARTRRRTDPRAATG